MVWNRIIAFVASFLVLFMVIGAGINLVLGTLGSAQSIAAAAVLALVVVSVGLLAAYGSKSRTWIANPYW